jgi:solute carrier family 25 S-adenosylmethionine transporter 26
MDDTQNDTATTVSTPSLLTALVAGGMAGTSVDVALFPIDTVKTRLQSPQGFLKAGGFRGIYNGLGAAAVGSAPGAALFFSTYETMKPVMLQWQGDDHPAICHMSAASFGEAAACLVRVPTEVIKAKMQTDPSHATSLTRTFQLVLSEQHGVSLLSKFTGGLYRGYGITLFREIPFAMIQFPMYEALKRFIADEYRGGIPPSPLESAACGSCSGAIAAAFTTPLDVIKTRLMLGADKEGKLYQSATDVIRRTYQEGGAVVFLSGIQPRVMWISIGGFVFFGAYEGFKSAVLPVFG